MESFIEKTWQDSDVVFKKLSCRLVQLTKVSKIAQIAVEMRPERRGVLGGRIETKSWETVYVSFKLSLL